jgi:hypothetical protein
VAVGLTYRSRRHHLAKPFRAVQMPLTRIPWFESFEATEKGFFSRSAAPDAVRYGLAQCG